MEESPHKIAFIDVMSDKSCDSLEILPVKKHSEDQCSLRTHPDRQLYELVQHINRLEESESATCPLIRPVKVDRPV